ncbi:MAG: phage tail protein, partial [Cypionkella sp.]
MATLLFTAVGTALGGPIGGALGARAGRSIDGAIIGGGTREGPRLKELALTTSSYGQPIPRHFGRMRAGGTIIWATELTEHRDKSGGGKGRPAQTSYSYTTSFAVALASRPIAGIGRIWADGTLLRGAGGDLKVAGRLRVHRGHGDQGPDPLIAAAEGPACPAFRGIAYAVFEDLALAEFGNRIPALSFEIVADEGPVSLAALVAPLPAEDRAGALASLAGLSDEGGTLRDTLEMLGTLYPLTCEAGSAGPRIALAAAAPADPPLLPPAAVGGEDDEFGHADGRRETRAPAGRERPAALRYYDTARDYQPGVQRAAGRAQPGAPRTLEFPGALAASDARG